MDPVGAELAERRKTLNEKAKACAAAIAQDSTDSSAYHQWALALQEQSTLAPSGTELKEECLKAACEKYAAASVLKAYDHDIHYNWGVALSDLAKVTGKAAGSEQADTLKLWARACEQYSKAVRLEPESAKALNNWGLAYQQMASLMQLPHRPPYVLAAVRCFRHALFQCPYFHRAVYNLGTMLYTHAEDMKVHTVTVPDEVNSTAMHSIAGIYICAACAMDRSVPVYKNSLSLVHHYLPLPYLFRSKLQCLPGGGVAPPEAWEWQEVVVDAESLRAVPGRGEEGSPRERAAELHVAVGTVVVVEPAADLAAPPGPAFRVHTRTACHYLIAESQVAADTWIDCLRLLQTLHHDNCLGELGHLLQPDPFLD